MKEEWLKLLKDLPISVNNLADPSILRESTAAKLDALVADGHTGAVALITKGDLSNDWWRIRLKYWAANLNLFVFASISHLPKEMEPASTEGRYRTLTAARECGAYSIAYIRPLIAGMNDNAETIADMFRRSKEAGCHAIVSSGFRGDDKVIASTGLEKNSAPDGQFWMRTLKIISNSAADFMVELAADLNTPYFTRTQCAVSYLSGKKRSLNPYYLAANFAGCSRCPLQDTCAEVVRIVQPKEGSIELLRHLGFKVTLHTPQSRFEQCSVSIRSQCSLCCTNCPTAPSFGVPWIELRSWDGSFPSWGEMSFARFLTGGMLVTHPDIPPGEHSGIRLHPRFKIPDGNGEGELYGVNSWLVWSEYLPKNKCFKCSYCFLDMFEEDLPKELKVTVGMSPSKILNLEVQNVRV